MKGFLFPIKVVIVLGIVTGLAIASASRVSATQQSAKGEKLFKVHCARCHGEQGEGKVGPQLVRSPHPLGGYKTATGLFNYLEKTMPFDAPGSLKKNQYWAIVAFLADANGLLSERNITIGSNNGDSIRLDAYP